MDLLISAIPLWYQYLFVCLLGLIIGSFLNVVIDRFHTNKSLSGHSHCMSCGHRLRWYELFPLLSYMFLIGRCKECGCKIPPYYFLVELATAVLFLMVFAQLSLTLLMLFSLALVSVLMVVTVYDIYHMIIPDQLVVLLTGFATGYFVLAYWGVWNLEAFIWHAIAAVGAFLFYGGLWFISKGRWIGFGDAKLAIPLAFILGVPGVYSFIVLSFWIGAILSLLLLLALYIRHQVKLVSLHNKLSRAKIGNYTKPSIALYSKSFTMKSEIPFAPFMVVAFVIVYLCEVNVLSLIATFI